MNVIVVETLVEDTSVTVAVAVSVAVAVTVAVEEESSNVGVAVEEAMAEAEDESARRSSAAASVISSGVSGENMSVTFCALTYGDAGAKTCAFPDILG